jgi:hypothetical protein
VDAFGVLPGAVRREGVDELVGQGDGASAGAGLRFDEHEAAADALGAVRPSFAAAGATAAVAGDLALQGVADPEGAAVEVDVGPGQPECFALAESEGEGDGPPGHGRGAEHCA